MNPLGITGAASRQQLAMASQTSSKFYSTTAETQTRPEAITEVPYRRRLAADITALFSCFLKAVPTPTKWAAFTTLRLQRLPREATWIL